LVAARRTGLIRGGDKDKKGDSGDALKK